MYNVHGSFVGQQTARGEQRQEFRNCGDCCSDWLYTTLQALAKESSIVSTSSMALECLHYTNFVSRFCVFCLSHVHSFLSLFLYIPRYIFWWAVAPFYTKQKISYKISLLGMPFFLLLLFMFYIRTRILRTRPWSRRLHFGTRRKKKPTDYYLNGVRKLAPTYVLCK